MIKKMYTDSSAICCLLSHCAVVNSLLVEFVVTVWAALLVHAFVVVNYSCIKMAFCQEKLADGYKHNESVNSDSH